MTRVWSAYYLYDSASHPGRQYLGGVFLPLYRIHRDLRMATAQRLRPARGRTTRGQLLAWIYNEELL